MSFELIQKVTYWTPLTNNGTGGTTWVAGIVVDARVADIDDIVFTPEGKQQHATKAVYTKVIIPIGAKVIEAEHDAVSSPVDGSQLVIKTSRNPSFTDMNRAVL